MKPRDIFGCSERLLRRGFHRYAMFVGQNPFWFLLVPIILCVVFGSYGGYVLIFSKVRDENRVWYLFSPRNAPSHREHDIAKEFFYQKGTVGEQFLVEIGVEGSDGGSLLRDGYLEAVLEVRDFLKFNLTVPSTKADEEMTFTYNDLCIEEHCDNGELIETFKKIYRNPVTRNHPNYKLSYPIMILNNYPYYLGETLTGVTLNDRSGRVSDLRAVQIRFQAPRTSEAVSDLLNAWDREVLKFISTYQHPLLNVSGISDGMVSDEVSRNGLVTSLFFFPSTVFIFAFVVLTSVQKDPVKSKFWEAVGGVVGPMLAIAITFGFLYLIGFPFTTIEVVTPFLVMAVGVDDCFLLLNAWGNSDPKSSVPERLARSFAEAGPSITLTSVTNALSFAIGATANTPSIRIFCIFTATGIVIDFVVQITFFAAVMTYGGRREAAGRNSWCFCIQQKSPKVGPLPKKKRLKPSDGSSIFGFNEASNTIHSSSATDLAATVSVDVSAGSNNNDMRVSGKLNLQPQAGSHAPSVIASSTPSQLSSTMISTVTTSSTTSKPANSRINDNFDRRYVTRIAEWWGGIVVKKSMQVLVLILMLGYWSATAYGFFILKVEMRSDKAILDDSPLHAMLGITEKYLGDRGTQVYFFVNRPPDFREREETNQFLHMVADLHSLPESMGSNSTVLWLYNYLNDMRLYHPKSINDFYRYLPRWLNEEPRWETYVKLSVPLDVVDHNLVDPHPNINRFMFTTGAKDIKAFSARAQLTERWRNLTTSYAQFNASVFQPHSFYVDQQLSTKRTTLLTVASAMMAMFVVCILFIPSAVSVLCATVSMISISLGVFGFLPLWEVDLDPISMATILMSIGFSVDFTCHVSYHYYKIGSDIHTPEERVTDALKVVGWPMVQVGLSTIGGVGLLAIPGSYMMNVFVKTVVLVVSLGLLHGLLILPVTLTATSAFLNSLHKHKPKLSNSHP